MTTLAPRHAAATHGPPLDTVPFLSLRDVRFSRGRYALMGAVVGLICLLLVFLTGLTNGLGHQNISAVTAWSQAGRDVTVAFGAPHAQSPDDVEPSFTSSQVSVDQLRAWSDSPQTAWAEPVGVSQSRADSGTAAAAVALMGLEPDSHLLDTTFPDGELTGLVVSAPAAEELSVAAGDTLSINGREQQVQAVVDGDYYSHTPVVWMPLDDWRTVTHTGEGTATVIVAGLADPDAAGSAAASGAAATVAATDPTDVRAALATETTTAATDVRGALSALPAYSSENGSLVMMQAFLYGISALVIAAFMAVFTLQRTRDIAVLKALGATNRWVVADGLLQAGIVLTLGALVGTGLGGALAVAASQAVPVQVDAATVGVPFVLTVVLGLIAAAVAVWRTTRVDPLLALGGS